MYFEFKDVKDEVKIELTNVQKAFSSNLAHSYWTINKEGVKYNLEGIISNISVTGIEIYNLKEELEYSEGFKPKEHRISIFSGWFDNQYFYRFPLHLEIIKHGGEELVGWVKVYSDNDVVFNKVKYGFILIVVNSIIKTFILWIIVLYFIKKLVARPMSNIQEEIEKLSYGRLDKVDFKYSHENEISRIVSTFNSLIDKVKYYQTGLESKVSERTASLLQAKRKADSANKAKSQFLANMSHELRTPLNSVIGFSQILTRRDDIPQDAIEDIQRISRSGEHLLSLINDVLDIAKIEAGKIVLNKSAANIKQMLDDVYQLFLPEMQIKGLNFEIFGQEDTPDVLWCDERKVKQVLLNLLSNALKFTEAGNISIHVNYRNEIMTLNVSDTGKGIASDEMDKVFEKFEQTKTGLESNQGTGLGLAISREFARLMSGELTIRSEVGVGTDFIFKFKANEIDATEIKEHEKIIKIKDNEKQYHILIVDDSELNLEVLSKLLLSVGFVVHLAGSGEQAIDFCHSLQPHLIFMDQKMPGLNGDEATKIIKEDYPDIKIVTLTASILEEDEHKNLTAGSEKVLRKPFKEKEIFSTLKELLKLEYEYTPLPEETKDIAPTPVISQNLDKDSTTYCTSILLVDDQEINLIIGEELISESGYEVVTVSSGKEALKLFEQRSFRLVITDCEMPGMDGYELTKLLLQLDQPPFVIGYTAGKEEKLNQCLESGMKDVLSKPFDDEELNRILKPFFVR